jgi:hypothetical protein
VGEGEAPRDPRIIVGAVIGTLQRPHAVVAGLPDADRHLAIVGRTVTLSRTQSDSLAAVLQTAVSEHPWPAQIGTGHFGGSDKVAITRVEPLVVVEVSADTGLQGGRFRHPLLSCVTVPTCNLTTYHPWARPASSRQLSSFTLALCPLRTHPFEHILQSGRHDRWRVDHR